MKKYVTYWDNGVEACGDIGPHATPGAAINCAYDVLEGWLEAALIDCAGDAEAWNDMICSACVQVDEIDTVTGEREVYWEPTDADLAAIGWIEHEEEE